MAQTIKIKRSTGSSAPATLSQGELAYSKGSDTFYVGDPAAANTPIAVGGAIKNNAGTPELATGVTATEIQQLLNLEVGVDIDAAGTDNSTNVTLAGTPDYITISGQTITRNQIDLTTDVTGDLPIADGGTGSSTASGARSNLGLGSLATLSAVGASEITDNSVGAAELNVSGNGTSGQSLVSDGDGTFSWTTISTTDTDVSVANLQTRLGEISSNTTIGDATDVTITTSGDLTVTGDLTVSGTTTTVNSETLTVDDNIVVLNNNVTGTPTENAGIEIERGTSANVLVRWNETSDRWEFTNNGTNYYNIPLSTEYTNNAGDITSVQVSSTDGSISGVGTGTTGAISFDLEVATIDGGTY